jgi:hypothetical protein
MQRIPPGQKIRKETQGLLNQALDGAGDITSLIVRLGTDRVVPEMLQQEVTDRLEPGRHEHRGTRTIPRFFSGKSRLKLLFATLRRAGQRWPGIRMGHIERQQRRLLRRELAQLADDKQDRVQLKARRIAGRLVSPLLQQVLDSTFGALSGVSKCLGTSSVWGIPVI